MTSIGARTSNKDCLSSPNAGVDETGEENSGLLHSNDFYAQRQVTQNQNLLRSKTYESLQTEYQNPQNTLREGTFSVVNTGKELLISSVNSNENNTQSEQTRQDPATFEQGSKWKPTHVDPSDRDYEDNSEKIILGENKLGEISTIGHRSLFITKNQNEHNTDCSLGSLFGGNNLTTSDLESSNISDEYLLKELFPQLDFYSEKARNELLEDFEPEKNTPDDPCTFSCYVCFQKFELQKDLLNHLGFPSKENFFECPICQNIESTDEALKEHIKSHTKPYICPICDMNFVSEQFFTQHVQFHMVATPFGCSICTKQFAIQAQLDIHLKLHDENFSYQCSLCGKRLKEKLSWEHHMKGHRGEESYYCPVCQKGITSKHRLIDHMNLHTGEKPYECKVCGKRFAAKPNLSIHKYQHDETVFKCDICGKKLGKLSSYRAHLTLHNGDSPFQCRICQKRLTTKHGLRNHVLMHKKV